MRPPRSLAGWPARVPRPSLWRRGLRAAAASAAGVAGGSCRSRPRGLQVSAARRSLAALRSLSFKGLRAPAGRCDTSRTQETTRDTCPLIMPCGRLDLACGPASDGDAAPRLTLRCKHAEAEAVSFLCIFPQSSGEGLSRYSPLFSFQFCLRGDPIH